MASGSARCASAALHEPGAAQVRARGRLAAQAHHHRQVFPVQSEVPGRDLAGHIAQQVHGGVQAGGRPAGATPAPGV
jgi:hypothetical protein